MKEIIIKTQEEFDKLPNAFTEYTIIKIQSTEKIYVKLAWGNSLVVAWGNSSVVARGNSSVEAWGNSSVEAWGNSSVEARENSSVEARENSSVVAWENSSVEAWGNSSVVARENSSVEAWENSSVVAWENSSVEARGNSSVEAWENSSVVAWENSSVVAWENSSVVARGNVGIHLQSDFATVTLFMFAVCWQIAKGKIIKKSKNAIIQKVDSIIDWFQNNGIKKSKEVILFKRVSKDFKTQENTENETVWKIGETLTHSNWQPKNSECGEGKFHACSKPYFCDQFREQKGDRYIAIEIKIKDTYQWKNPEYPHKIAFREGKVLYECNKFGKRIEAQNEQ